MRDEIRAERRIELAFEEHRYFGVRRRKIANITDNVPAYGILPESQSNGAIVYRIIISLSDRKFQQNPGY